MAIKPYRGRSRDRLTAIINAQNPTSRLEGVDFTYGPVQTWTGPLDSNTRVILTPIPANTYTGPIPITYKRLPIQAILQLPVDERRTLVVEDIPFSTHTILSEINDAYGLDLEATEVDEITYSTDPATVTLRIKNGNYAWLPSEVELPARYIYDVSEVVTGQPTGFDNPSLTDISSSTTAILAGFENQPLISITSFIANPISGFENIPTVDIGTHIPNSMNSFDNPINLPELGFISVLDGFNIVETDLFIATELSGFTYNPV